MKSYKSKPRSLQIKVFDAFIRGVPMDLDTLIVTVFCQIDDALKTVSRGIKLRQRRRALLPSDAEVLTIETVGEYLGMSQDKQIYLYLALIIKHCFLILSKVHRTTFTRQAANLWRVKELVWQEVLRQVKFDPEVSRVDSFPFEVCRYARANRYRRLREISA